MFERLGETTRWSNFDFGDYENIVQIIFAEKEFFNLEKYCKEIIENHKK